jgi:excisionase family DNA binding protein
LPAGNWFCQLSEFRKLLEKIASLLTNRERSDTTMTNSIVTLQSVLDRIDILTSAVLSNKKVLNIAEASAYTGLTVSYIYKLTSTQEIPHYKPRGKILYFDRSELDAWLKQGKISSQEEIQEKSQAYILGGLNHG